MEKYQTETLAIHAGYNPKNGDPLVLPLNQSTTYKYDNARQVADWFDLKAGGHIYSRLSNPTVCALEDKLAALEGGVAAVCTSSGQSASMLAVLNIASAGDHIICAATIYGGTYNLFYYTMKKMGFSVTFVDLNAPIEELRKAVRKETKCVFAETLSNPQAIVLDIEKFARLAHEAGIPLIVDNTFATPYLCRPLEWGADIVTHSCTKYQDGHATSLGGVVVDGGKFNWKNGKFPELCEPDPSYHGTVYTEWFGAAAYAVKLRAQLIRDIGNYLAPMNAFLINLGTETLHLRMQRHSENALKLAQWLSGQEGTAWVRYPGLEDAEDHELSKKYLPKGCSGVFTAGIKGGRDGVERFMNALKLASIAVHVADLRTMVLHPASMTHRQLTDEQQKEAGITPDLIRISVGLENIDDIIADFEQALKAV